MKGSGLNLSRYKKVSSDAHTTTLRHPDGHEMRISRKALSPKLLAGLDALPTADMPAHEPERQYAGGTPDAPVGEEQAPDVNSITADAQQAPQQPSPVVVNVNSAPQPDNTLERIGRMVAYPPAGAAGAQAPQMMADVPQPTDAPVETLGTPPPAEPQRAPASLAPQAASPLPQDKNLPKLSVGDVYQTGMAGIQQEKAAEQQLGQDKLQAAQTHEAQLKFQQDKYQSGVDEKMGDIDAAIHDFSEGHVNPNHYIESKSALGKVTTAIGLILGGFGGNEQNGAMKFLNGQIDRDIEAQKANINVKQNLITAYQKQFDNLHVAENMARATELGLYATKLDAAAAKATDPMAKARALQASAQLKAQILPLVQQAQIRQTLNDSKQGQSQTDPAQFVPYVVPKDHQEAVYKEIKRAQDTRHAADTIMKAFDEAAASNTALKRLGGARGEAPAIRALTQALMTTVQDQEGTVREAAMNQVRNNLVPSMTDLPSTKARQREALQHYLTDKSSAPRAKSYGINLDHFASTAPESGKKQTEEGATGTFNGKPVVFRGGKWQYNNQ